MNATALTHKEMAAHIRKRLRASGIKALCRMGSNYSFIIEQVDFDVLFTDEEQETILTIAKANHCTFPRGMEIDTSFRTCGAIVYLDYRP